jgi:hypothetical protein
MQKVHFYDLIFVLLLSLFGLSLLQGMALRSRAKTAASHHTTSVGTPFVIGKETESDDPRPGFPPCPGGGSDC